MKKCLFKWKQSKWIYTHLSSDAKHFSNDKKMKFSLMNQTPTASARFVMSLIWPRFESADFLSKAICLFGFYKD